MRNKLYVIFGLSLPLSLYAFGSFQLLDFSTLPNGISGQPYGATINFVYSGDWVPSVSVVGQSLPNGLKISDLNSGNNGIGSFRLNGTPTVQGTYKINILLTDNKGASLLKPTDLVIEDGSVLFSIKSSLPKGVKGQEYKGQVTIDYIGEKKPHLFYTGFPEGVFVNQDESVGSGRGTVQLSFYGKPSRSGDYLVTVKASNEKQTEVKSLPLLVEDFVKVEPSVLQTENTIVKTVPEKQKIVNTNTSKEVKIEDKPIVKTQSKPAVVASSTSSTSTVQTLQVDTVGANSKSEEKVEGNDDISFYKKIRQGIRNFLLKIANNM
jgi:hypothetical protein